MKCCNLFDIVLSCSTHQTKDEPAKPVTKTGRLPQPPPREENEDPENSLKNSTLTRPYKPGTCDVKSGYYYAPTAVKKSELNQQASAPEYL